MLDFPTELMDCVFDNLHPNPWDKGLDVAYDKMTHGKPDLSTCSLVSRSWNTIAQRHLFRNVVYSFKCVPEHSYTSDLDEEEIAEYSPYGQWDSVYGIRYKTFPMFCAFLRDNPAVRSHIMRLKLDAFPEWSPEHRVNIYDNEQLQLSLFTELLRSLPRLQTLRLYNIALDARPVANPSVAPLSLKELYISYCTGPAFDRAWEEVPMSDIIECFDKVETLHLFDCYDEVEKKDVTPLPVPRFAEAQSLIIECIQVPCNSLQYFVESSCIGKLRSLTLEARPGREASDLLQAVGPQLEELRYNVRFDGHLQPRFPLNFTQYPNLRSFTLGLHFDYDRLVEDSDLVLGELVTALILPARPDHYLPHLNEIVIHIDVEDDTIRLDRLGQSTVALWRSLQEALLTLTTHLALPGIWVEYRTQEARTEQRDAGAELAIGSILSVLKDSKKLLWREPDESRWPLIFVSAVIY